MDRADNSFVVLEPQGIGYPGFLARVADTLLVLTVAPPRVLFLDSENILRRQVSLESTIFNPKGFAVRADGSFLVAGGIAAGPGEYHLFEPDGQLRQSFLTDMQRPPERIRRLIAGGALYRDEERSRTVVSLAAPHTVGILEEMEAGASPWMADTTLVSAVDDTFMRIIDDGTGRRTYEPNWDFRSSRTLLPIAGDVVLNAIWDMEGEHTLWEVYDLETGSRLAQARSDEALYPLLSWSDTVLAIAGQGEIGGAEIVLLEALFTR